MKVRTLMTLLVAAVLAPLVVIVAIFAGRLWELQRDLHHQRFVERVAALRLALDTEIEATDRLLTALSAGVDLDGDYRAHLQPRFARLLESNPGWTTLGLVDVDGTLRFAVHEPGAPAARQPVVAKGTMVVPVPDRATIERVASRRKAALSDLVVDGVEPAPTPALLTFLAVPVMRGDTLRGAIYVGIEHARWLDFLKRYPIATDATITLNDRAGRIIARTLDDEKWAGRRSSDRFLALSAEHAEGAFTNRGVDGIDFYSAYSRSAAWGWMISTGVPVAQVDAAMRDSMLALAAAAVACALLALGVGLLFARRLIRSQTRLVAVATAVGRGEIPPTAPAMLMAESEQVREALHDAACLLKDRQQRLAAALDAAEAATAEKDRFIATLGHECRNPLNAMRAALEVLRRSERAADHERAIAVLGRQVGFVTRLLDDLLDAARVSAGKFELRPVPVDLGQVVSQAMDLFRSDGRCAHLSVAVHLAPVTVMADPMRLEQVVANLVENACRYTPPGGSLTIRVAPDGDHGVLETIDTGHGIRPESLARVFEPFAQTGHPSEREHGGLGLGLSVVRQIVELHGGQVSASSEGPGRGARFVVRLPRAQPDAGRPIRQPDRGVGAEPALR